MKFGVSTILTSLALSIGGMAVTNAAISATPMYDKTYTIGGSGYDMAHATAIDGSGNLYYTGHVAGNLDVDPTSGTDNRSTDSGSEDALLTKINSNGSYAWSRVLGDYSFDRGSSMVTDDFGNVYLAGQFQGSIDFNPNGSEDVHTSANNGAEYDIYVTKINANGSYAWTRVLGGYFYVFGRTIDVDSSGNVYVAGAFSITQDFEPEGQGEDDDEGDGDVRSPVNGTDDIFLTKLNANGSYAWTYTMGSDGYDMGHSVTVDNNDNVYFAGHFEGAVDLDPTENSNIYNSTAGSADVFIMKFNDNGNYQWTKTFGGSGWDGPYHISSDSSNNIYVSGLFEGTSDLDPTNGTDTHISTGPVDLYVTKLNGQGDFEWARTLGESSNFFYDVTRPGFWDFWGSAFTVDGNGNAYVARCFVDSMDFDPTNGTDTRDSNGAADIFITQINSDGSYGWTKTMGGSSDDCANAVTTSNNGNEVVVVGNFQGTVNFNPDGESDNRTSAGDNDIFVTRFKAAGGGEDDEED